MQTHADTLKQTDEKNASILIRGHKNNYYCSEFEVYARTCVSACVCMCKDTCTCPRMPTGMNVMSVFK